MFGHSHRVVRFFDVRPAVPPVDVRGSTAMTVSERQPGQSSIPPPTELPRTVVIIIASHSHRTPIRSQYSLVGGDG